MIVVNDTPLVIPSGAEVELIPDTVKVAGEAVSKGFITTVFDVQIGILPLYIFIGAACLLLVIAAVFYWVARMRAMSDVQNFRTANGNNVLTGNSILGFRLSNDLRLVITAMQYSAGCIAFGTDYPNNKSIWLHRSKNSTAHLGGKAACFLTEQYAVSRDLNCESALTSILADYNNRVTDPKARILSFVDWQNFGRRVLMGMYPNGIPAASWRQLNPADLDRILPKNLSPSFLGSLIWNSAAEMAISSTDDNGFFSRYGPLLAVGTVVIIALVGAFFFPLGG